VASFLAAVCQLSPGSDAGEAVRRAARAGAGLVVLPAFALSAPGSGESDDLLEQGSALAREAGCHLVAGTALVPASGGAPPPGAAGPVGLRHVAWLFSPDGRLLGEQAQTHTTREEKAAGWAAGDDLRVFRLDALGGVTVGLAVGLDAWIPEVCRILALDGADLIIAPLALLAPWSEARQVSGLWQETQQNQTLGIEACLVGEWNQRRYAGRSAIVAPCEMVPDESGFVVRAASEDETVTILGPIDLAARRKVIDRYDILGELNLDLFRAALPGAYGAASPAVVGADPPARVVPRLPLSLKEKAFRSYLSFRSRPSEIRGTVASLGIRPSRTEAPPGAAGPARLRRVRAAALQLESFYAKSPREYAVRLGQPFREAVEQGAQLVAFPELTTIPLVGLLPGVEEMARTKPATAAAASPRLADIIRFMEPVLRNVYYSLFPALAAAGRVWVMAGSTPLPGPDGRVYNLACLFGPDGRLVGSQRKLNLFPRERDEGLSPGSRFEVFETPVGRLALPICMDATYFETYRLAALMGAEIVAAPVSNVEPYHFWKLLRGAWPRVQETPVYAVQSVIVGDFLGDPMTGKASIFAPAELTPGGDGVLAQCEASTGRGLAVADLDLDALAAFRAERSALSRLNLELIRRHLPRVYADYARSKGAPS